MNTLFNLSHDSFITLKMLFDSMPAAVALIDRDGRDVIVNERMSALYNVSPYDLNGHLVEKICQSSAENIRRDFRMFDAGLNVADHEIFICGKICLVSVKPVRNNIGLVVGEIANITDITKQKDIEKELIEANEKLQFLANKDPLTGLLNTRAYHETCENIINIANRNNHTFSVLFIDIDHFKNVNDTYGHDAGDLVLKATSKCIIDSCRKSDIIGRVGGEEFSIFLPETDNASTKNIAEKLRANIEKLNPSIGKDKQISITVSIGVASKMTHHKAITDIQRDADHAMYHAKKNGRNKVAYLHFPCYIEQNKAEPEINDPNTRIKILNLDDPT